LDLTRDLEIEYRREAGDTPELLDHADDLRREVLDLRLSLGEDTRRGPWRELVEDPDSIRALEAVRTRAICTPPSTPCGAKAAIPFGTCSYLRQSSPSSRGWDVSSGMPGIAACW